MRGRDVLASKDIDIRSVWLRWLFLDSKHSRLLLKELEKRKQVDGDGLEPPTSRLASSALSLSYPSKNPLQDLNL